MSSAYVYQAFISYSHKSDRNVAISLQRWMQRFAKPWYKLRQIRVFRDETDLSATPSLWKSVRQALDQTEYLILIASSRSAQSKWIKREIYYWLTGKDLDPAKEQVYLSNEDILPEKLARFFIVLTEGKLSWNESQGDFDWQNSNALPPFLTDIFKEEPLWVDLTQIAGEKDLERSLGRSNPEFLTAVARLLSPIRKIDFNRLISEDYRELRKTKIVAWSAALTLSLLTLFLILAVYLVLLSGDAARKQSQAAEAGRLVAEAQAILAQPPVQLNEAARKAFTADSIFESITTKQVCPIWLKRLLKGLIGSNGNQQKPADPAKRDSLNQKWFSKVIDPLLTADENDHYRAARLTAMLILRKAASQMPAYYKGFAMQDTLSVRKAGFIGEQWIYSTQYGNRVDIWDAEHNTLLKSINLYCIGTSVNGKQQLEFSGDGKWLATADLSGKVQVRSLPQGNIEFEIPAEHAVDRNKEHRNSGQKPESQQGVVQESFEGPGWHIGPTGCAPNKNNLPSNIDALAIGSNGKYLAIISNSGRTRTFALVKSSDSTNPQIVTKPVNTFFVRFENQGSNVRIWAKALSASGKYLALSSSFNALNRAMVFVWDTHTGRQVFNPIEHEGIINDIAYSIDDSKLATAAGDETVRVTDMKSGIRLQSFFIRNVTSVQFDPSSPDEFLVTTAQNIAQVWNTITGKEVAHAQHNATIRTASINLSGTALLTAGDRKQPTDTMKNTLSLWKLETVDDLVQARIRHTSSVNALALSSDGSMLASAGFYDQLIVWEASTGKTVARMPGMSGLCRALSFTNDDKIVSSSYDSASIAYRWDTHTSQKKSILGPGYSSTAVVGVAKFKRYEQFVDQGKLLVRVIQQMNSDTADIEIWDLQKPQKIWTRTTNKRLNGFGCSQNGKYIAWTTPDTNETTGITLHVQRTFTENDTLTTYLPASEEGLYQVKLTFSSDNSMIALNAYGNALHVLELPSLRQITSTTSAIKILNVAFCSKSSLLAVAYSDKQIRIYDAAKNELITQIPYESNAQEAILVFDSTRQYLYTTLGESSPKFPSVWRWMWDEEAIRQKVRKLINIAD